MPEMYGQFYVFRESYCVKSKIPLRQSMPIHLRNNPDKIYPDPIWNDGALGFFYGGCKTNVQQQQQQQQQQQNKMSGDMRSVRDIKCHGSYVSP